LLGFLDLESLELFDDIKLDLRRNPARKLQGDIPMSQGATTIPTGFDFNPDGIGQFDPFLGEIVKSVGARFTFKQVEIDWFKIGLLIFPKVSKIPSYPLSGAKQR
jgi:hypothetical protein